MKTKSKKRGRPSKIYDPSTSREDHLVAERDSGGMSPGPSRGALKGRIVYALRVFAGSTGGSRADLIKKAKINRSTFSMWMNGLRDIDTSNYHKSQPLFERLAKVLGNGFTAGWLMGLKGSPSPDETGANFKRYTKGGKWSDPLITLTLNREQIERLYELLMPARFNKQCKSDFDQDICNVITDAITQAGDQKVTILSQQEIEIDSAETEEGIILPSGFTSDSIRKITPT